MSNVVALSIPHRRQRLSERAGALTRLFARGRRAQDDVFWLKENAEHLNILECTHQQVGPADLGIYADFYEGLPERLAFFPQYYRFLLSIALDLEALGLGEDLGEGLCAWVAREGLPEAEFSDLQRAEARRLLARRGVVTSAADPGLDDRLRAFASRGPTFSLPNKKAAYELTHIVFYLSEYGRRSPDLPSEVIASLDYAGLLAFLDRDLDLLAEICIAMRYCGVTPSAIWESHVLDGLRHAGFAPAGPGAIEDDYHEYLVSGWLAAVSGDAGIGAAVPEESRCIRRVQTPPGPLRRLSVGLYGLADRRCGDWEVMRNDIEAFCDEDDLHLLRSAEASSPRFSAFFEIFARVGRAVA